MTSLTPATPSSSTAATGAAFAALPPCLTPEAFTGEGHFEGCLQQFTTAVRLSGWQTATRDNPPQNFPHRHEGNVQHF